MNGKLTAVFRADASRDIGGGHVVRCLALANALVGFGWSCAFACRKETAETVPALNDSGYDLLLLECEETQEPSELLSRWPDSVNLLVVDHYGRDASFESVCRPWAHSLLVIDDLFDRTHDCDVLLNQNIGADTVPPPSGSMRGGSVLYGQKYALLRQEFQRWTDWRRSTSDKVRSLLITFGMTDAENATSAVLEALRFCLDSDVRVDVVVGSSNSYASEIEGKSRELSTSTVHFRPSDMASLMSEADLAITAAGSTCWELAFMGVPMLTVAMSPDQEAVSRTLARVGASHSLGSMSGLLEQRIGGVLRLLVADPHARESMSRNGRRLVDGKGAVRLAEFLTSKIVRNRSTTETV